MFLTAYLTFLELGTLFVSLGVTALDKDSDTKRHKPLP